MATIEKRTTDSGTGYRVKIRLRGFPPETATFERLTDARDWAKATEADMKKGRHFGQSKSDASIWSKVSMAVIFGDQLVEIRCRNQVQS